MAAVGDRMAAEQADQPCQACLLPITPTDRWTNVGRLAFHQHCFNCSKCRRHMRHVDECGKFDPHANDKLVCRKCEAGEKRSQLSATDSTSFALGRKCGWCGDKLPTTDDRRFSSSSFGYKYCSTCCRCVHCRVAITDDNCFELLDELFCMRCELQYRNKRYLLAKMGCGPQMPDLL